MIFRLIIALLQFISILLISVILHEAFHMITAKLFGIKVPIFSVGFWKPFWKKTIKGTEYRITPYLLGGYVALEGDKTPEKNKIKIRKYKNVHYGIIKTRTVLSICFWKYELLIIRKKKIEQKKVGWMARPYHQKVIVALSGVVANLLILLFCYWVNYRNIGLGLQIDWLLIKSIFTKDFNTMYNIMILVPSIYLLQMSMMNLCLVVFNLLPYPSLDGSFVWIFALEKVFKENFMKVFVPLVKYGFISIMILQFLLIGVLWLL